MSTATYTEGWTAGVDKARADLLDHRRMAARWAKARLDRITGQVATDDFGKGYLDGYRATLANAVDQIA
jgi:hypothetical protein